MLQLRLNPELDTERIARDYAEHKCVQIPDFLEEASAARLEALIPTLPWRLILQDDSKQNLYLTREEFSAKPPAEQSRLMAGMQRRAAEGIGHLYLVYPMINAALFGWDAGHAIHELTEFLNSKPVIEFARAISGKPGITKLDAHASCFLPGHYLNSHVDDGEIDERQVAYTIGFTRGWMADWGGMLLVWDKDGDVLLGRCPRFNTMTVFDGRIPHSVSAIAPFAPRARYTVAGWFRDDPPVAKSVAPRAHPADRGQGAAQAPASEPQRAAREFTDRGLTTRFR